MSLTSEIVLTPACLKSLEMAARMNAIVHDLAALGWDDAFPVVRELKMSAREFNRGTHDHYFERLVSHQVAESVQGGA
jgi:hypothetical protein